MTEHAYHARGAGRVRLLGKEFCEQRDAALKRHKRDELPFSQRAACEYAFEAGMAAAPDHAREGALREALSAACNWIHIPEADEDFIWQRLNKALALADGKEGGE